MSITPDPATALTNVKTALIEIEELLVSGSKAYEYAFTEQGAFPYWVNEFRLGTPRTPGTNILIIPIVVQAILQRGWITEGTDGEFEIAQLTTQIAILTGLAERQRLVSPSFPGGVPHVDGGMQIGVPGFTKLANVRGLLFPLTVDLKFTISRK